MSKKTNENQLGRILKRFALPACGGGLGARSPPGKKLVVFDIFEKYIETRFKVCFNIFPRAQPSSVCVSVLCDCCLFQILSSLSVFCFLFLLVVSDAVFRFCFCFCFLFLYLFLFSVFCFCFYFRFLFLSMCLSIIFKKQHEKR